jgi:hypothetical protein
MTGIEGLKIQVERLAERLAIEHFDGQVVDEPIPGFHMLTRRRLVDPLAGVRATKALANAARALLVDQARAARAAGRSWDEIGEALGLSDGAADEPRAEAAFTEIVEGRRAQTYWPTFRAPSTCWRCESCGEPVADHGPTGSSHPDDQESGHDESCERHAAALAAWRTRTGWDE